MSSPIYRKYWKAKFSQVYTASIVIEKHCARLSGDNMNTIEVSNAGINIQPGPGKDVAIQSLTIKGPLIKKTSFPFTLLPGPFSFPVDTIDIELLEILPEIAVLGSSMSAIVAAG